MNLFFSSISRFSNRRRYWKSSREIFLLFYVHTVNAYWLPIKMSLLLFFKAQKSFRYVGYFLILDLKLSERLPSLRGWFSKKLNIYLITPYKLKVNSNNPTESNSKVSLLPLVCNEHKGRFSPLIKYLKVYRAIRYSSINLRVYFHYRSNSILCELMRL